VIKYIETKYIPYAEWWRVWPCETQQPALCKVLIPADFPRYKVVFFKPPLWVLIVFMEEKKYG
jgi:hypothetical protein